MKNKLKLVVILIALGSMTSFGQQKCKVLKADIAGSYKGDCKKGLAHGKGVSEGQNTFEGEFRKGLPDGKGTISYLEGGKYSGSWKKGLRNGTGKYLIIINGKDSVQDGIWKKDKYIGKKPVKQFEVTKKKSVSRYTVKKVGKSQGNKVTIKVRFQGTVLKSTLRDISVTDGVRRDYSGFVVFENINHYPFNCDMRYNVPSTMGTVVTNVEFSFKIFEAGEWLVEINH